jgi:hypothetical protein
MKIEPTYYRGTTTMGNHPFSKYNIYFHLVSPFGKSWFALWMEKASSLLRI